MQLSEASEPRSSCPINTAENNNTTEPVKSYANAMKSESFPTKDQAIILPVVDGISTKEYVCAVGSIIGPKALRCISRISNGRICIYLDKKETVSNLTGKNQSITINNTEIDIRPMITSAQRIILSNVSPVVPNKSIVEKIFMKYNVRLCFRITPLKTGMADPEYSQILSFRRQVYVNPEDVKKISDSFTINFEDTVYRLFTTSDSLNCFVCKQEGHIAKQCPHYSEPNDSTTITDDTNTTRTQTSTFFSLAHLTTPPALKQATFETKPVITTPTIYTLVQATETLLSKDSTMEAEPIEETPIIDRVKRPLSETLSDNPSDPTHADETKFTTPKLPTVIKTQRSIKKGLIRPQSPISPPKSIDEILTPAKGEIENPEKKHILTYHQFARFLENAFGALNPLEIAQDYTSNTLDIIKMLNRVHPLLKDRSIKNRTRRLYKKLLGQPTTETPTIRTSDSNTS
ncbi:Transposon TX1 uncharacterized 82 kDa protein [Anthophora quadrimaculata]